MPPTVEHVARAEYDEGAYLDYARALDRLLGEHEVVVEPRFVDVPVPGAAGGDRMLRTFVMEMGAGTPVLFLNGTPATSAVWVPLLAELRGMRAIVVDRPGHGLTGELDYADVPDIRPHAVTFLESLLDLLELDRVVVAGNSFGGLWALFLALARPDLVSGVVLPGLPPGLLTDHTPLIFGLLSVPWLGWLIRRVDPPRPASTRRMFAMMGDPPKSLTDAFIDAYVRGQRLPNVRGGTVHLIHHVRFPGRLPRSLWLDAHALGALARPVLLLAGARDFLGDLTTAGRIAAAIPGARFSETGVGHLPWLQEPRGVAEAIGSFVDSLTNQRAQQADS